MSRAIWMSVGIGVVVQGIALLIAKAFGRDQMIAGWAVGAVLRLVTLVIYGLLVPKLGLPLTPALLSLALVLFVTTFVELYLLTHGRASRGPTLS